MLAGCKPVKPISWDSIVKEIVVTDIDQDVAVDFKIKNNALEDIRIKKITKDCSCINVQYPEVIHSGKLANIRITIKPSKEFSIEDRTAKKVIYVETTHGIQELTIQLNFKPTVF